MCLIIHKPASAVISRQLADDVFTRNKDGFGLVYHNPENMTVNAVKVLGNRDQIWEVLQAHMHHELIIHWRMQTHGDVDLTNCHPYELMPDGPVPSYMMHNGVLSTGNAADKTKSDTWHYIRDYLRPLLAQNPELIHNPAFHALVGSHIGGSNKFAIMDARGEVSIINRKSGVDFKGMWFSNTYAWNASQFGYYSGTNNFNGGSAQHNNFQRGQNSQLWDDDYTTWWQSQYGGRGYSANKASSNTPASTVVGNTGNKVVTPPVQKVITLPPKSVVTSQGSNLGQKKYDYSMTRKDPLLQDVKWRTVEEPMDLEDLYQDAMSVLTSVDRNKINRAMLLRMMRHLGFDDALALLDLVWEGKLEVSFYISAVTNPTFATTLVEKHLPKKGVANV